MTYCSKCGKKIMKGARFCDNCGNRLVRDEAREGQPLPTYLILFAAFVIVLFLIILEWPQILQMLEGESAGRPVLIYSSEGTAPSGGGVIPSSGATTGGTMQQPQPTAPKPIIAMNIIGCDTGFDVSHGLGEITNVFAEVSNSGDADAANINLVASATDEGGEHPNKRATIPTLPAGQKTVVKLTLDTTYQTYGTITVIGTSSSGTVSAATSACAQIDENTIQGLNRLISIAGGLG